MNVKHVHVLAMQKLYAGDKGILCLRSFTYVMLIELIVQQRERILHVKLGHKNAFHAPQIPSGQIV